MQRLFIYNDGNMKESVDFNQFCSAQPRVYLARIAYDPGLYISINNETKKMMTSGYWDVSKSLTISDTASYIVHTWEILELFFHNFNIVPKWIEGDWSYPYYDEESGEWKDGLITTVRYKIKNLLKTLLF